MLLVLVINRVCRMIFGVYRSWARGKSLHAASSLKLELYSGKEI